MARLTHQEIDRFAQELGSFVRSGMPLPDALHELASHVPPGRLQQLSREAAQATQQGTPLAEALRKSTITVPREFIALIECGEITGDMRSILDYAMQHARRVTRFRSALLTGIVYPVMLLVLLILVLAFIANFVIPYFIKIFEDLRVPLPMTTDIVFSTSPLFQGALGAIVVSLLILLLVLPLMMQSSREPILSFVSQLPGFSVLTATGDTAIYTRFLAEMLPRGVPLPMALQAAALAVTRNRTRLSLRRMSKAAEQGNAAHEYLDTHTPATAAFLFRQGEESGRLAESCAAISDYCEDRFERLGKYTMATFEPALIFIIAVVVAFVIFSIYMPLFSIPKVVGKI